MCYHRRFCCKKQAAAAGASGGNVHSAFVCANDVSSCPLKIESWIHDMFFAFDVLCAGAVAVEMDGPAKPPVPVRMN